MKATTFVSRSNAFASAELASRSCPARGTLKRDDRRRARHSHNAELTSVSLSELRKEFGDSQMPQPRERQVFFAQGRAFEPSFLLADRPAPSKYVEVVVTRKGVSRRHNQVETLMVPVQAAFH